MVLLFAKSFLLRKFSVSFYLLPFHFLPWLNMLLDKGGYLVESLSSWLKNMRCWIKSLRGGKKAMTSLVSIRKSSYWPLFWVGQGRAGQKATKRFLCFFKMFLFVSNHWFLFNSSEIFASLLSSIILIVYCMLAAGWLQH